MPLIENFVPSKASGYGQNIAVDQRGNFSAGTSSGLEDLKSLGYSSLAAFANAVGADNAQKWLDQRAADAEYSSFVKSKPQLERVEDQDLSSALPFTSYQVGKQIPNLVGAVGAGLLVPEAAVPAALSRGAASLPGALGGGSMAARVAAATAEGTSVFAARRAALEAGQTFGKAAVGGLAFNEAQSIGSLYQAAKTDPDNTQPGLTALALSPAYALAETLPEATLIGRIGRGAFSGNLLTRIGKSAGVSAATGATSELAQTGLETAVSGPQTPDEIKSQFLNAGVVGGLVEGIFGGAGGIRGQSSFLRGATSDIQQAFTQPQTGGTPLTGQTPPAPPAGTTVVPPVTPNAPAGGAGASTAPITPPVVSGGTTAIAQASQQQTQADFAAQQQQAIQDQREKIIDQFGLRGEDPTVGQFFNRPISGANINRVADALGPIANKLDQEDAAVMDAILQADKLTGGKLVSFKFNGDKIEQSVQQGVKAVLSVANKFQIGEVRSVAEAGQILNALSQSAKGAELEQINAIHQALTGKDTEGYIASQTAKTAKGKPNAQQQQQLSEQVPAGLGTVPEQGSAGQVDGGLTGLLQPGAVQPVGTGSVAGATVDEQVGQPSGEGVRPSASIAADNGSDVLTVAPPQVNLTARAPETNELLRQVFGGESTAGELVAPTAIGGPTRVAKPQVTGVSNETGTTPSAGIDVAGRPGVSAVAGRTDGVVSRKTKPKQYDIRFQYFATDLSHISSKRRDEISKSLLARAITGAKDTGEEGTAKTRITFEERLLAVEAILLDGETRAEVEKTINALRVKAGRPTLAVGSLGRSLLRLGISEKTTLSPKQKETIAAVEAELGITPTVAEEISALPEKSKKKLSKDAQFKNTDGQLVTEITTHPRREARMKAANPTLPADVVTKGIDRIEKLEAAAGTELSALPFSTRLLDVALSATEFKEFPDGITPQDFAYLYKKTERKTDVDNANLEDEQGSNDQDFDKTVPLAEETFGTNEDKDSIKAGFIESAGGSQGAVESQAQKELNAIEEKVKALDAAIENATTKEEKEALQSLRNAEFDKYKNRQKEWAKNTFTPLKESTKRTAAAAKIENEQEQDTLDADWVDAEEAWNEFSVEYDGPAFFELSESDQSKFVGAGESNWTSTFVGKFVEKLKEQEQEDAVQVESADEGDVREPAAGGEEVVKADTEPKKPARTRKAKAESKPAEETKQEVKTPKEQWDELAAKFPQMPPYATLNKDEKIRWDDVAERGVANLAAANTILSTTVVATPTEKVEAKPAAGTTEAVNQINGTAEQKKIAQELADSKGGSVVWQNGDLALIRGYSILTGQPVYAGAKGSSITRVDIESFTGKAFTSEEQAELVRAKQQAEKQDAEKHAANPFVKFDANGLAVSQSVSPQLTGVMSGWKQMLGIKANVYVTTIEDAKANKDKLTGPQRAVASAGLDPNEGGSMRKLPDGSYYVAFVKGTSTAKMLETIAHELGHVHEREAFANADPATQKAIKAEFEKWKASTKGKTAKEVVESLRARATGRSTTGFEGKTSEDMSAYWKSFSEWYADQVSRWATTSEKPLTVVEKFFARLGAALKKFYYSLKGQKYLPSETMKQFLDKIADGAVIIDNKSAETVDNEFASQAMFVGAKGVETRGMTEKQTTNMVTAKIMDAQGELREDVWYTTGWLRGADNQWRTEVSDRDAKMTLDKVAPGGKVEMNKPYRLGDVLSHLPLYRLYPELADYTVSFDPNLPPQHAAYDTANKSILMSGQQPDDVTTLLHEVQHAIQDIEGFGRGGSAEDMDVLNLNAAEKFYKASIFFATKTDAQDVAILNYYRAVQDLHANRSFTTEAKADAAFQNMLKELSVQNKFTEKDVQQIMYLLISGEVEARDVEARREYNNELRRQVVPGEGEGLPYDMQLVFDKNTGTYKSIGKTLDTRAQEQVEKLPPKWQPAARTVTTTLMYTLKKAGLASMITEDVINAASKYMKSAQDYLAAQYARGATQIEHEKKIDKILQQFDKLPENLKGIGKGSVNEYIHDSTSKGLWGYYPDARLVGTSMAQIDPEFKRRFNAFPKAAQDLIKAVFEQGHDSLAAKQKAVADAIDREYAGRLEMVQGDAELTKKFEKEKNLRLAREAKLLGLDSSKPYAYLGRYGDYVVVGKSAEYKFHEEQAKSGPVVKGEYLYGADSRKWLEDNRSNPAHYVVQFAETLGEADQIASQLNATGNYDIAESFEKEPYSTQGGELFTAVSRLRNLYDRESEGADPQAAAAISNLLGDLYLHTVSEASARKSEFQRLNISGADKDMMRNLATRGRADAHFLAALEHNDSISDSLSNMRKERDRNRREAGPYFNELIQRHANSMEYKTPGGLATALQRMSTVWYLSTSPSFYLQQILQTGAISLPYMAGRLGYFRSARAIKRAYGDMATLVKGVGLTDSVDFSQAPADVRDMLNALVGMGKIDVSVEYDTRFRAGDTGVVANVMNKLQGVNNRIETINRATAAIAAYRGYLERYKNNDTAAATKYAADVVSNTHGSYDAFNTPRIMSGPAGKVLLQFKRFQIIQISMLAKLLNTAFKGASAQEKTVARHSLAFIAGQMGVLGGMMAVPFAQQAASMLAGILGDPDEPDNWEYKLRQMIGDKAVADLLISGVPAAMGVDIGGKVGLGNLFSILPYTDVDLTNRAGAEKVIVGAMGPTANLGLKFIDGIGLMAQGQYYKGLEQMLPNGVANLMKGTRFAAEGITMRNGDVVLKPDEISMVDAAFQAVGLPTNTITDRQFTQKVVKEFDKYYAERTTEIKGDYVKASRSGDSAAMSEARDEWVKLQESRVANGYKRQPYSELYRAPMEALKRERNTIGGVEFGKSNRRLVESLSQ